MVLSVEEAKKRAKKKVADWKRKKRAASKTGEEGREGEGSTHEPGLVVGKTYTIEVDSAFEALAEFKSSELLVELLLVDESGLWVRRLGKNSAPTPYLIPLARVMYLKPSDPPPP